MKLGSDRISDEQFVASVADCSYPADHFHHADHLRLGWLMLEELPFGEACDAVARMIQCIGRHNGKETLYHETITKAWMHLLASHEEDDFEQFLQRNQDQLTKAVLLTYWNEETLKSPIARSNWIPPDLNPLPALVDRGG